MKKILLIFAMLSLKMVAMNETSCFKSAEIRNFLSQLLHGGASEQAICQQIKARLPMSYSDLCQEPRNSLTSYICELADANKFVKPENLMVTDLVCEGEFIYVGFAEELND